MPVNSDITVVVTCFNYGRFLADSVASALEQVGGPPHVIVVDDGSTEPETVAMLNRLPGEVRLIRQSNAGLSSARNAGMRATDTPYLIALDADDRLVPSALIALREALAEHPEAGFAYGRAQFFDGWEGLLQFPPYDPYRLLYRHTIGSTALMRRELFEQVGGFDPEFRRYEDWEFWVHALACGWHGWQIEAVTLMYRRHGSNTMNFEARRQYRSWYRKIRRKHPELYDRGGRRQLAAESALGPVGRAIHRWWWGPRPLPAVVEGWLQALLWRPRSRSSS